MASSLRFFQKAAATILLAGLTIPSGTSFDIGTGVLNVGGDVTIEGTLIASTGTVTLSGNWDNAAGAYTSGTGSVEFTATTGTQTITTGGNTFAKDFYNFTHSGAGSAHLNTNDIKINGSFANTAGTFNVNAQTIAIFGDWSQDASAAFTHGSQTVVFDGGDQTVYGSTTAFYNFTGSQCVPATSFWYCYSRTGTIDLYRI